MGTRIDQKSYTNLSLIVKKIQTFQNSETLANYAIENNLILRYILTPLDFSLVFSKSDLN